MRPIDADALIDKYGDWYTEEGMEEGYIGTIKGIVDSMPTIEPERKTGKWISVSERLPEPRTDVWVNSDIEQIQGCCEENVKIWYASFGQGRDYLELIVNARMPLPEAYKGEQQ